MPYLPPAIEEVIVNTAEAADALREVARAVLEAAAAVKTLQDELNGLHGKTVDIGIDASAFQAAAEAANSLADAEFKLSDASQLQVDWSRQQVVETDALRDATDGAAEAVLAHAAATILADAQKVIDADTADGTWRLGALHSGV